MDENDFFNCTGCKNIIPKKDNYCKYCGKRNAIKAREESELFDVFH